MFKFWQNIKDFFAAAGVLIAAAIAVFFMGKNAVPHGVTQGDIENAKEEVKKEQEGKDVFQKLDDLNNSIGRTL